jgi:protein gp37
MASTTPIEWTDATWNPIGGCTRVSEGCRNCYAEVMAARFSDPGQWGHGLAERVKLPNGKTDHRWTGQMRFNAKALTLPLTWKKPRKIFVNSTSDLFHEGVEDDWLDRIFAVMALCPQHTFQILTKRPERARAYLAASRSAVVCREAFNMVCEDHIDNPKSRLGEQCIMVGDIPHLRDWPLPNVWLGTSVEDQATADARIPHLLATPAAVRFISAEPLLGRVVLSGVSANGKETWNWLTGMYGFMHNDGPDFDQLEKLDWVIGGGESGPGARAMHPDWARSLRDQCQAAGVPFFFKQWGEHEADQIGPEDARSVNYPPGHVIFRKVGKARAGRLLDGREWNGMPNV